MTVADVTWIKCANCEKDTEFVDDPDGRELLASEYGDSPATCEECEARCIAADLFNQQLKVLINNAISRDVWADTSGDYPVVALDELSLALDRAQVDIAELQVHQHSWNENDYCDICRANGRA